MQELIPFAKEMLRHKPKGKLLKLYLLGSVFAVLGTALGLVDTLCHPFFSSQPLNTEILFMLASENREIEADAQPSLKGERQEEEEQEEELSQESKAKTENLTPSKTHRLSQRNLAYRLHAS